MEGCGGGSKMLADGNITWRGGGRNTIGEEKTCFTMVNVIDCVYQLLIVLPFSSILIGLLQA